MTYVPTYNESDSFRSRVLHSAATLFLENGYSNSSIREIAVKADVDISAMIRMFKSKENILCSLVSFVLDGMFAASKKIAAAETDDPLAYYVAETVLQLHIAELRESIRELFLAAYSLLDASDLIYRYVSTNLTPLFAEYNPKWEGKDFFEREIATGSIMRGMMSRPCDLYFTIDRKTRVFLECSLAIYNVPQDKVEKAVAFSRSVNFAAEAKAVVDDMLEQLKNRSAGDIFKDA